MIISINNIYKKLLQEYSAQNWWPTISNNQKFEIVIGAILTQNTSWKNVEKAILNLKKHNLISPKAIIKTPKTKLAELIRSSGYYNQKAERLKSISKFFIENKSPAREQLLNIKGVGPETADSILLYAYQKPVFVIDSYTRRIFSRIGLCSKDEPYDSLQKLFISSLPKLCFKS